MNDPRNILAGFAARQEGLFAMWQAAEAGVARSTIHDLYSCGELRRVQHGIYHVAAAPVSLKEEEAAIMLRYRLDPGVAFSHFSALAHYGVTTHLPAVHHLTVPERTRRHRKVSAVIFHRLHLRKTDTVLDGIVRYTSPLLTLHDLAAWGYPRAELLSLHARLLRKGLLGRESLDPDAPEAARVRGHWRLNFRRYLLTLQP